MCMLYNILPGFSGATGSAESEWTFAGCDGATAASPVTCDGRESDEPGSRAVFCAPPVPLPLPADPGLRAPLPTSVGTGERPPRREAIYLQAALASAKTPRC